MDSILKGKNVGEKDKRCLQDFVLRNLVVRPLSRDGWSIVVDIEDLFLDTKETFILQDEA